MLVSMLVSMLVDNCSASSEATLMLREGSLATREPAVRTTGYRPSFKRWSFALALAGLALVSGGQTLAAEPTDAKRQLLAGLRTKAEAGDASAQAQLADRYDTGTDVEPNSAESFKWWLKAAAQGVRAAQHNVAVAYLAGLGVAPNRVEAVKWFTKAAEQGDTQAGAYAERLKQGKDAAPLLVAEGEPQTAPPAARSSGTTRYGEKEEICAEVVAKFRASHTYIPGVFMCVDFASGVWYELMHKGINAKIRVGVAHRQDLKSIAQADHAWVMAEVSPGIWLAIEPQASVVYPESNPSYYHGYDFSVDFPVREYNRLVHVLWEAAKEYDAAVKDKEERAARYNNSDGATQRTLLTGLNLQRQLVNRRFAEVKEAEDRLLENLQRATPSL